MRLTRVMMSLLAAVVLATAASAYLEGKPPRRRTLDDANDLGATVCSCCVCMFVFCWGRMLMSYSVFLIDNS